MRYRPEIDGLRAVAVAAVVLFHAGLPGLPGGYLGVDVFFVISGYLIAGLIAEDLAAGRFSIADFYERRARRLLPALFVVLLATMPLAWASLMPGAWEDYLQSVLATLFFGSNLLYWSEAGYFDTAAAEKPLLHTWSLAVEEQFYLVFPLALILLWRLGPRRAALALGGVGLVSLAAAEWGWRHASEAAFYLAPFRAWEFLAGTLAALIPAARPRPAAALAGLGMIAAAFLLLDESTPTPSLLTLLPVIGTVLVLRHAAAPGLAHGLLAARPVVGLGLVSYSLYLWHQPVFTFARLSWDGPPPAAAMAALTGLSLVLAWITWRRVEQPFRRRDARLLPRRPALFAGALAGGAALAAAATAGLIAVPSYLQMRFPDLVRPELTAGLARPVCPGFTEIGDTVRCRVYGDGPTRVVVWGDSHAKALEQALVAPEGLTVYVLSNKGCPPVLGVTRTDRGKNAETCQDPALTESHAAYVEWLHPDRIILAGRWSVYLNGWHKDGVLQKASTHWLSASRPETPGPDTSRAVLTDHLTETIGWLQSTAPVAILRQPPDLAPTTARQRLEAAPVPAAVIAAWHETEDAVLAEVAAATGAELIPSRDILCDAAACDLTRDGLRMYLDDNHLSIFGARLVWSRIAAGLDPRLASR